jgi:methyl-accepting chemotaxis protein
MSAAVATDLIEPTCPAEGLPKIKSPQANTAVTQNLFQSAMRSSLALADANGNLVDASSLLTQQAESVHHIVSLTKEIAAASRTASDRLNATTQKAHGIGHQVVSAASGIVGRIGTIRASMSDMARNANEIDAQMMAAASQVVDLRKASSSIQSIAREIQLLAVNAGVEAARHGTAGRGFAVIAEAVKKLADQTRHATDQTERHLSALASSMAHLQERGNTNLVAAQSADAEIVEIADHAEALNIARDSVSGLIQDLDRTIAPLEGNAAACHQVMSKMHDSSNRIDQTSAEVASVIDRFQRVVGLSEDVIGMLLGLGDDLPVSNLANLVQETAGEISTLFEQALKSGAIRHDQLFDDRYRVLDGTNPQQYMAEFTTFTDRVLADLQESVLAHDKRIVFCAAVDRNGYLPTHNRKFSQPQSDDAAWNAQNCRHRRIFNDRSGIASARNHKPVLLQTYRRDMGGGVFHVMNELSAPIFVNGKHWGGLRIAFRI